MVSVRKHLIVGIPMQFMAWVIIFFSLWYEPFSWFLIPNINNTPAFITISKWLIQSLAIINFSGYLVYKFRNPKLCIKDWDVITFHALFSVIHIIVICVLIILVVGFEDL